MKLAILSTLAAFASAGSPYGLGSLAHWTPPGPTDYRSPCPMLNTLSNHEFLPHDGKNITKEQLVQALSSALNFDTELANSMWQMALIANPDPNATHFSLDQLNTHNLLEHDASLSRADAYHGNNWRFDQTVFDETKKYWTAPVLTADMLANSKMARQLSSRATNPNYTFTSSTDSFSVGEVSAPLIIFGDGQSGTANRCMTEYFFEHERFPTSLGWKPSCKPITPKDATKMGEVITNATTLLTGSKPASSNKRRHLHFGHAH
ncbi:hypothetical protein ASPWEDRAFT_124254 [Aspergillus wentii DTO 134E9]|uniref:Heme haloperoxidase family profile domain-containing protein n=1 Tax=Aspergillus wentii DTO 134E9 TaxID=1073089 RepID=A0A1L9S180_ASPWE|nr:uncharacterized protein ASPWEDRAFT_124254 [Aspergillus wentii DTO 134E9]KAI9931091.1 hypothetical protein MW887_010748 [Aspergillus wentii]OJJ40911.1 hypothetical protein ASPWEDRAFT_124254 [Aspergillus wentii DTO 134E9]